MHSHVHSVAAASASQSAVLVEAQRRGKSREKVIDSSQHKGPQDTAGGAMVNE